MSVMVVALLFSANVGAADLFNVKSSWRNNWTQAEKNQYKLFLGLQAADAATTFVVLRNGGEELNPVYGSNPNVGKMLAIKAGSNIIVWGLLNYIPKEKKGTILNVLNIITGAVVINNGAVVLEAGF